MAWLDNIRNAMHPYDDDYIENEERAAEEELGQESEAPDRDGFEEKQPRPVFQNASPGPRRATPPPRRKSRR